MFDNAKIVLGQLAMMTLQMLLGYFLFKQKTITSETTRVLSVLLNKYIVPICIFRSFHRPFSPELAANLGLAFVYMLLAFGLSIGAAELLYPKSGGSDAIDRRLCAIMPNSGFMVLPLLEALLGSEGAFYSAAPLSVMYIVLWSYGVFRLSGGDEGKGIKNVLLNPASIATLLGLVLFFTPVMLPDVVYRAVDTLGNINTPIAMLIMGCFLAQTDLLSCFRDGKVWHTGLIRLLVLPALVIALLLFSPLPQHIRLVVLLGCAAPCAMSCAMFGQLYGTDYIFSTKTIALTTALSVITLPGSIVVLETLGAVLA